jgi:hypothetical protein
MGGTSWLLSLQLGAPDAAGGSESGHDLVWQLIQTIANLYAKKLE